MTDTATAANPILADAIAYYASRRTMNNPKGWDHVQRVIDRAVQGGFYVHADPDQVDHARAVLATLVAAEQDDTTPESTEPDFPADSPLYEVWEFHGETPVRKIGSPSGNPYTTFGSAAGLADRRAADPDWTRGKTDPSFRVVDVTVTRALVRTPSAIARPTTPTSTQTGSAS